MGNHKHMNMKIKKLLVSCILLIFILVGCNTQTTHQPTQDKPFKIGFIGPLSGEINYGLDFLEPAQLAIEEINQHGGNLELIAEDGKCNAKDALSALHKLIEIDQVDIVTGLVCTTETQAVKPFIEDHQIFSSTLAIAPNLVNDSHYLFTLTPSLSKNVQKILEYLDNNAYRKIAILHAGTDATADLSTYTQTLSPHYNIQVVADERYSIQSPNLIPNS